MAPFVSGSVPALLPDFLCAYGADTNDRDKRPFHQEGRQHIYAQPRGRTGFWYGDL